MPPGTGRVIAESMGGMIGPHMKNLFGMGMGAELMYSFVIIICSLLIYRATREFYELSAYSGIKYFRQAFLFFACAYFFRGVIKFTVMYFGVNGLLDLSPRTFGVVAVLTQFFFLYLSSMALFYLAYSLLCKYTKQTFKGPLLFHTLALTIAIISVLLRSAFGYFLLNAFLIGIVLIAGYSAYKRARKKRKGTHLYLIYFFLAAFWALNILDTLVPRFFEGWRFLIYLSSLGLFLTIFYKVMRKAGSN